MRFMAQFELFAAFIIGFISSYGLLLFIARGREFPPAVERDIFLSFAIGAAFGVGTAVLRLAAVSSVATGAGANLSTTFLILSPMLATLDIMPIYLYLNRKPFSGKPQAFYVSISLALGIAAMEITFKVFRNLSAEGFLSSFPGPLSLALFVLSSLLIRAALGGDVGLSVTFPGSARAYVRPFIFMTIFNFLIAFYQVDWKLWPMTALALVLSLIYLQRVGVRLSKVRRKLKILERRHYT